MVVNGSVFATTTNRVSSHVPGKCLGCIARSEISTADCDTCSVKVESHERFK